MKIFKNTLITIILCSTGFIFAARAPKGAPAVTPTTKPIVTPTTTKTEIPAITQQQTYSSLLNQIKTKTGVVDNNNMLTPAFITFVKEAAVDLSDDETKALLQAGANIHAKWSGNQVQDKITLGKLTSQIQSAQGQKISMLPEYYDAKTNLLNEERVVGLIRGSFGTIDPETKKISTPADIIKTLRSLYIDRMINIWNKLNLNEDNLLPALKKQIETIVMNTSKRSTMEPAAPVVTQSFYDNQTNLINQTVLKAEVLQAIQAGQSDDAIISSFTKKYQDLMIPIWNERNIQNRPAKIKAIRQQITDTVESEFKAQKESMQIVPYKPGLPSVTKVEAAKPTLVEGPESLEFEIVPPVGFPSELPEFEASTDVPQDLPPVLLEEQEVTTFIAEFLANSANKSRVTWAYDQQYPGYTSVGLLKDSQIVSSVILRFPNNKDLAIQTLIAYLNSEYGENLADGTSTKDAVGKVLDILTLNI